MKYLDLTLPSPAENLAGDEALLDLAEAGEGGEVLRFWESPDYFVVVGYANKVATEVNEEECKARGVPILRRCSGGGTVLQGPGCLNYALILQIGDGGTLGSIAAANGFIMERNGKALASQLFQAQGSELGAAPKPEIRNPKLKIEVCGHTDLAINGRKFSGNSQRRHRRFLLFHGTFLLNFNLARIEALLWMPSKQPDYRRKRDHGEFLVNLHLPADQVKLALRQSWHAHEPLKMPPLEMLSALVRDRYANPRWNRKF
jgi:lipoate---protein ligase